MSTPITQAALDAFKRRVVSRGSTESDLIEGLTELVASMARLECALAIERSTLAGALEIKRGVEAELAEANRRLSNKKSWYKMANDSAVKHAWMWGILREELLVEREKVRTLRLACERIVEQWDKNHIAAPFHASSVMYSWASTALATTEDKP